MLIKINNENKETPASNVQELAEELKLPATGVAIAINNEIVTRAQWQSTKLSDGIEITIIKAACGG